MQFKLNGQLPFSIEQIDQIATPRLLAFHDRIENNILIMKDMLEQIVPESGFELLCAHVKTHKSKATLKMLMDAGVCSFKSSLNEVLMCLEAGVPELFVAYPLLDEHAVWMANCIQKYPNTRVTVQLGSLQHADILRKVSQQTGLIWNAFLDTDVGMHRTGIGPGSVVDLYKEIDQWSEIEMVGLHGYDGHIHHASAQERQKASEEAMQILLDLYETLTESGVTVQRILTAGSPSFPTDLAWMAGKLAGRTRFQVSPGTWIYWDSGYDQLMPGVFNLATLILARVLERHENRLTLNLGHKRWAADQGPVDIFSIEGATLYSFNEEHTVLSVPPNCNHQTGDYVLIAPRHVCPTVNLWEHYTLISQNGEILNEKIPVDGRNR